LCICLGSSSSSRQSKNNKITQSYSSNGQQPASSVEQESSFEVPIGAFSQVVIENQSRQSGKTNSSGKSNRTSSKASQKSRESSTKGLSQSGRSTKNSSVLEEEEQQPDENSVVPIHLEGLCKNLKCFKVQRVGELRGEDIKSFKNGTFDMEKIYEMIEQNRQDGEEKEGDGEEDGKFIDPFDPDNFKDELIDIDFGAIDAFTKALNEQMNSQKDGSLFYFININLVCLINWSSSFSF
jgi:hypothetical protein